MATTVTDQFAAMLAKAGVTPSTPNAPGRGEGFPLL
jgi:hypothetical protein